jgi:hypothetical protein
LSQLSLSGSVQAQEPQLLPVNFAFLLNNILIPIPKKASSNKKSDNSNILKNTAIFISFNKATEEDTILRLDCYISNLKI